MTHVFFKPFASLINEHFEVNNTTKQNSNLDINKCKTIEQKRIFVNHSFCASAYLWQEYSQVFIA